MYEGRGWMLTVSSRRQLTVEKGGNVVAEGRSREVDERNSVHLGGRWGKCEGGKEKVRPCEEERG